MKNSSNKFIHKIYSKKSFWIVLILFVIFTSLGKKVFSDWNVDINAPAVSISATCNGAAIINNGTCNYGSAVITITYDEINAQDSGLNTVTHNITGASDNGTFPQSGTTYTYIKTINNSSSPVNVSASATDLAGNTNNTVSPLTFDFTFTILGVVYIDDNKNGIKDGAEQNYSGTPNITLSSVPAGPGTLTPNVGGYTASGLTAGRTYTVTFTPPSGYNTSYPQGSYTLTFPCVSSPPSWNPSTSPYSNPANQPLNASCSGGNVINLNFGMVQIFPWFQCIGADCRDDNLTGGFDDPLPTNNTALTCNSTAPASYASIGGPMSNTPGVIYSGDSGPDLGLGFPSANNWLVGGSGGYEEVFQPVREGMIRTSYSYIMTTLRASGITPIRLSTVCMINNCNLPANLAGGVYITTADIDPTFNLKAYTFPAGKNYIFLADSNINIQGKIIVPVGSTATFIAAQNINISGDIGETSITTCNPTVAGHPGCDIEGFFSADQSFNINDRVTDSCPGTPSLRLNIAGAIVTNAGLNGGTVNNYRDLCDVANGNRQCPTFTIVERPDFVLNAPELLKHPNTVWQEIAP